MNINNFENDSVISIWGLHIPADIIHAFNLDLISFQRAIKKVKQYSWEYKSKTAKGISDPK